MLIFISTFLGQFLYFSKAAVSVAIDVGTYVHHILSALLVLTCLKWQYLLLHEIGTALSLYVESV